MGVKYPLRIELAGVRARPSDDSQSLEEIADADAPKYWVLEERLVIPNDFLLPHFRFAPFCDQKVRNGEEDCIYAAENCKRLLVPKRT